MFLRFKKRIFLGCVGYSALIILSSSCISQKIDVHDTDKAAQTVTVKDFKEVGENEMNLLSFRCSVFSMDSKTSDLKQLGTILGDLDPSTENTKFQFDLKAIGLKSYKLEIFEAGKRPAEFIVQLDALDKTNKPSQLATVLNLDRKTKLFYHIHDQTIEVVCEVER